MDVSKIIAVFKAQGIGEDDARAVLGQVAELLMKATADRRGVTVDELSGLESGKSAAQALNAKLGYGRKGR